MPRPPRLDAAGVYHVMNRGAARQTIFNTRNDGHRFLALVDQGSERFEVSVLAYCLMTNHYHLLLRVPDGVLSAFMHLVGSRYTRHFNDAVGRDGPLLRARYHSLHVDSEEYMICAGRYIHRNPLDIRPQVALDTYRWSSYQHYVGRALPPRWLSTSELLAATSGSRPEYRRLVEGDAGATPSIGWAIDVAMMECGDAPFIARPHARRTLQVAMLALASGALQAQLEQELAFARPDVRDAAIERVLRRIESEPDLAVVAERARTLASVGQAASEIVPGTISEALH